MKLMIYLKETKENQKFVEELKRFDLGNFELHTRQDYCCFMLEGNFFVTLHTTINDRVCLYVEDEDYVYLSIQQEQLKRFVIKEE